MKKVSGLVGAVFLFAGPAFAADLPANPSYKVPPIAVAPVFSWTGCYVGADVGGAWPRQNALVTTSTASLAGEFPRDGGVIGGPYVGCNYQFIPAWVVGVEGDFSWTKLDGALSGTVPGGPDVFVSRSIDSLASARARLGWVVVPNALVYGTGGVAWAHTNFTGLDTAGPLATSFSDTQTGWVAGGGIDWAPWSNNWVVRFEYLHYQFNGVSGSDPTQSVNFGFGELKVDTVRAGLSYKF